jgi:hypothetical protein
MAVVRLPRSSSVHMKDVTGQVLNSLLLTRLNSWATKDIEPGMPPVHHHIYRIFRDLFLEMSILIYQRSTFTPFYGELRNNLQPYVRSLIIHNLSLIEV